MPLEGALCVVPALPRVLHHGSCICVAQVRIAACAALVAFVQCAGSSYCATNSGYLAAGVVLHMDDSDPQVAEAACQVWMHRGYMECTCMQC